MAERCVRLPGLDHPTRKEAHGLTPSRAEYQSLATKSDRVEYLARSLASLQLELDLLRAKYPHPRRTIDQLEEHAQEQVEAIIALTEQKEERAAELARKRRELEDVQRATERLRGKVDDVERKADGVTKRKGGGGASERTDW
jgi:chromosome segregation ATPase